MKIFFLLISVFACSSAAFAGGPEDELIAAIRMNEVGRAIQIFAANNIDPDFVVPEVENDEPRPAQTILELAAVLGHWQLVEAMFERKPNPNLPGVAEQSSSTNKREREEEENADEGQAARLRPGNEPWRIDHARIPTGIDWRQIDEDVERIMDGVLPAQIEPNADEAEHNNNADWNPGARHPSQNRASTDDDPRTRNNNRPDCNLGARSFGQHFGVVSDQL